MQISAKALLKTESLNGVLPPVTTVQAIMPRSILAELNKHRMFSNSARSSRAIPVSKVIEEVVNYPFIPHEWRKNVPGMQGGELCNYEESQQAINIWIQARDNAVHSATKLCALGIHKQYINRLLEPFMWVHVLITSIEWENFRILRCHPDAEPHMQLTALRIMNAVDQAIPNKMPHDKAIHLPFIEIENYPNEKTTFEEIRKLALVSAARCARVSYKPFDGETSFDSDVERGLRLYNSEPKHSVPFEHACMSRVVRNNIRKLRETTLPESFKGNFLPWIQFRHEFEEWM